MIGTRAGSRSVFYLWWKIKEFAEHRSKKGNYGVEFFGYASYYANMWSKNLNLLIFLTLATDKENLIVLVEISVKRNPTGTVVLLITSMKSIDLKSIDFRCSIIFSSDFTVFSRKVVYTLLPKFSLQVFSCANFEMYYTCIATEMSQVSRISYCF